MIKQKKAPSIARLTPEREVSPEPTPEISARPSGASTMSQMSLYIDNDDDFAADLEHREANTDDESSNKPHQQEEEHTRKHVDEEQSRAVADLDLLHGDSSSDADAPVVPISVIDRDRTREFDLMPPPSRKSSTRRSVSAIRHDGDGDSKAKRRRSALSVPTVAGSASASASKGKVSFHFLSLCGVVCLWSNAAFAISRKNAAKVVRHDRRARIETSLWMPKLCFNKLVKENRLNDRCECVTNE